MHRYALALGSNRRHGRHGAPERVLHAAIATLAQAGIDTCAVSPILRTAPLGPAGRAFANATLLVESALEPPALLATLKAIERMFGRRRGRRWGPRVLDLDILLWSGGGWRTPALAIPHPALAERRFVLDPLVTIAPAWRVPGANRTVRQLHARLTRRLPMPSGRTRSGP